MAEIIELEEMSASRLKSYLKELQRQVRELDRQEPRDMESEEYEQWADEHEELEDRIDEVGITCNKNAIPYDTQKPFVTSGIRLGTAAVTTRGFKPEDLSEVAKLIAMTLKDFEANKDEVISRVAVLCNKYPLYE